MCEVVEQGGVGGFPAQSGSGRVAGDGVVDGDEGRDEAEPVLDFLRRCRGHGQVQANTDKGEVLFTGSAEFQRTVVDTGRAAPTTTTPLDTVITALAQGGAGLTAWGEPVRQRQRIVDSAQELRERELIKMDALTAAVADALRHRGVQDITATLLAQVGVAAFMTAFRQWSEATEPQDFAAIIDDALTHLRAALCEPPGI